MSSDRDWSEVVANLRKSRKQYVQLSQIIGRKGADPWTYGNFYKTVIQATLLFGAETYFVSPSIGKILDRFHHRVACRMAVMRPRRDTTGRWV